MTIVRTANITVDWTPPSLRIVSPVEGSVLSNPIVGFMVEALDDLGIRSISVVVDGKNWGSFEMGRVNKMAFTDGMHMLNVSVEDLAGWSVRKDIIFSIYTTGNLTGLYFLSPQGGMGYTPSQTYTVKWAYDGDFPWTRTMMQVGVSGNLVEVEGTSYDVSLTEDGPTEVFIRLEDDHENYVSASATIVRDVLPPIVSFPVLKEARPFNTTLINVSWSVIDMTPIVGEEVYVDGVLQALISSRWAILDLDEGEHTILVKAVDSAGNIGEASIIITVDLTSNRVRFTYPADRSYTDGFDVRIEWDLDDPSDLNNLSLYIDGIFSDVTGSDFLEIGHLREEGPHTFTIVSYDLAGNSNRSSITLFVDRSEPFIDWSEVPAGFYRNGMVNLTFQAIDSLGIKEVVLTVDAQVLSLGSEARFALLNLTEGTHNISLTAYDHSGKHKVLGPITIIVDTIPPVVSVDMDRSKRQASGKALIYWTVEESGSGLIKVDVSEDGGPWIDMGTLRIYESDLLMPGDHAIVVRATDQAGNAGNATWRTTVDAERPIEEDEGRIGGYWFVVGAVVLLALIVAIVLFVLLRRSPAEERRVRTGPRRLTVGLAPVIPTGALSHGAVESLPQAGPKVEDTEAGSGYIRPKAGKGSKRRDPRTKEVEIKDDQDDTRQAEPTMPLEDVGWLDEKQRVLEEEARGVFVGQQPVFQAAPAQAPAPMPMDDSPDADIAPTHDPDESVMFDEDVIEFDDLEELEEIEDVEGMPDTDGTEENLK